MTRELRLLPALWAHISLPVPAGNLASDPFDFTALPAADWRERALVEMASRQRERGDLTQAGLLALEAAETTKPPGGRELLSRRLLAEVLGEQRPETLEAIGPCGDPSTPARTPSDALRAAYCGSGNIPCCQPADSGLSPQDPIELDRSECVEAKDNKNTNPAIRIGKRRIAARWSCEDSDYLSFDHAFLLPDRRHLLMVLGADGDSTEHHLFRLRREGAKDIFDHLKAFSGAFSYHPALELFIGADNERVLVLDGQMRVLRSFRGMPGQPGLEESPTGYLAFTEQGDWLVIGPWQPRLALALLPFGEELDALYKASVGRCLAPRARRDFGLDPALPDWCANHTAAVAQDDRGFDPSGAWQGVHGTLTLMRAGDTLSFSYSAVFGATAHLCDGIGIARHKGRSEWVYSFRAMRWSVMSRAPGLAVLMIS